MTSEQFVDPLPGVPPIESPFFEEHKRLRKWEGETLRVADQLHEFGYAVIEFPEQRLGEMADGIVERLEARYAEQRERDRIPEAWVIDSAVRAIAANAGILSLLELYGRAAIPFQTFNFRSI